MEQKIVSQDFIQRQIYDSAIRSRIVYFSERGFKENVETKSLSPSAKFITDNAIRALKKADIYPCTLHIMPALLLRKLQPNGSWKYRLFYSSYNCCIPENHTFTITAASTATMREITRMISNPHFMDVLENVVEDTKWQFLGVMSVVYEIRRIS